MSDAFPVPPASPAPAVQVESGGERGYDTSRVHTRGIFIFYAGFIATIAVLLALVWWFERGLVGYPRSQDRGNPREARTLPQPLQPSPGHPALPWQDMAALRSAQERQLHSAGPIPNDAAHRHIPIDDAMEQLLKSGALTWPWQAPATQPYVRPPRETVPSVENRT